MPGLDARFWKKKSRPETDLWCQGLKYVGVHSKRASTNVEGGEGGESQWLNTGRSLGGPF